MFGVCFTQSFTEVFFEVVGVERVGKGIREKEIFLMEMI